MSKKLKVLFAGESWSTSTTHTKGVDFFTQNSYAEGAKWVKEALEKSGMTVTHLPCHRAILEFPQTMKELSAYDCVILSDIGTNTLLLHPETTVHSRPTPNRLKLLKQFVTNGGALIMVGGYLTFAGIDGKARYHDTPVEDVLPVTILPYDDRVEAVEGFRPVKSEGHAILKGLPNEFPLMLFYNRVKAKAGANVLLKNGDDPILTVWESGRGRTAAFAPDCAPHGATPEFLDWPLFGKFWTQLVQWVCGQ